MATKTSRFRFVDDESEVLKTAINKRNSHLDTEIDRRELRKRSERKNCKKVRYRDSREAKQALWSTSNKRVRDERAGRGSNRREARTYRCGICKGWHLTSQVLASDWVKENSNVA